MKKYLPYLIAFLLISVSSLTYAVESSLSPTPIVKKEKITNPNSQILNKKNWESKLGRKLNFKERISIRLLQKQFKKQPAKSVQKSEDSLDRFALAGMIAGLLGILFSILLIPLVAVLAGIVAIVISAIGMNRTEGLKGFRKRGRGMAIAGLVIGILLIVFWVGILLLILAALGG